ncbi:MAG: MoxR family ATPase [Gammaproteobacteria bacterium]|nr:MoxR family ATPase [Gammaproteobacteria bacterium]
MTEQTADVVALRNKVATMGESIGRAFIGQAEIIEGVIVALLAGGHVLLEGVPGLGKTLLVRAIARTFDGSFARIQFTPDLMPSDVTGHAVYDPKTETFRIRRGPVFANLLLADEINRAPAKTQAALLEVMQEQQVTIEGRSTTVPLPFMTIATQNPIEQEGTYPLPEAQLDRFLLKVLIDYPDHESELRLVTSVTDSRVGDSLNVDAVSQVLNTAELRSAQQLVAATRMDPSVVDYAVRIVRETRESSGIRVGAGPRGSISIVRAARARAVLQQRDFVTPDDIKSVAIPALRHRILLAPELEIEAYSPDDVLRDVIDHVSAPRQ